MKTITNHTLGYLNRNALIAVATCLLLGLCAVNQTSAEPKPGSTTERVASAQRDHGTGRLVINRIANLGTNVIVRLSIDGAPTTPIGYGHTYNNVVPAGRHVIALLPSPDAKWSTPSEVTLNVRKGQTYNLTVMDDGSGRLTLRGA